MLAKRRMYFVHHMVEVHFLLFPFFSRMPLEWDIRVFTDCSQISFLSFVIMPHLPPDIIRTISDFVPRPTAEELHYLATAIDSFFVTLDQECTNLRLDAEAVYNKPRMWAHPYHAIVYHFWRSVDMLIDDDWVMGLNDTVEMREMEAQLHDYVANVVRAYSRSCEAWMRTWDQMRPGMTFTEFKVRYDHLLIASKIAFFDVVHPSVRNHAKIYWDSGDLVLSCDHVFFREGGTSETSVEVVLMGGHENYIRSRTNPHQIVAFKTCLLRTVPTERDFEIWFGSEEGHTFFNPIVIDEEGDETNPIEIDM